MIWRIRLEKIEKLKKHAVLSVLSNNGTVCPPMAMFIASQPYLWEEFDVRVFDTSLGDKIFNAFLWMLNLDADVYMFSLGDNCPHPDLLQLAFWRINKFGMHVVVPPVVIHQNGTRFFNAQINNTNININKSCGIDKCEDAAMDIVIFDRATLLSLFMTMETIKDDLIPKLLISLGINIYIDWTVDPIMKWKEEASVGEGKILNAYDAWYTRVKRGLSF
jgi:hypothetical protein